MIQINKKAVEIISPLGTTKGGAPGSRKTVDFVNELEAWKYIEFQLEPQNVNLFPYCSPNIQNEHVSPVLLNYFMKPDQAPIKYLSGKLQGMAV